MHNLNGEDGNKCSLYICEKKLKNYEVYVWKPHAISGIVILEQLATPGNMNPIKLLRQTKFFEKASSLLAMSIPL